MSQLEMELELKVHGSIFSVKHQQLNSFSINTFHAFMHKDLQL